MTELTNMELVQKAVRYLANRCDGACEVDGQGFNQTDTRFGHSLANQDRWTVKQGEVALKMIRKYRKQLGTAGFPIDRIFTEEFKITPAETKEKETEKKDKTAVLENNVIKVDFPFDWDTVNTIKTIPGRKFDPVHKYWTCPVSEKAVQILEKEGFNIAEEIRHALSPATTEKMVGTMNAMLTFNLKKELFPYQKEGVAMIEKWGGRALLGDEMGLGKTIQAIAWLSLYPKRKPVVILVPAHLKLNWAKELRETLPDKNPNIQVLSGKTPYEITGEYIIINYDILSNATDKETKKEIPGSGWVDHLIALKPEVLIFDEAHFIKSNKTLRTKATKRLAKGVPYVLAITGTPLVNRPLEGFNIFQIINSGLFPNWWNYVQTYCGAKHNGFGWDYKGSSNEEELHDILIHSCMIRRKKAEVLPELPDKLFSFIPMEIENEKEYIKAEQDFIQYLRETKGDKAARKAAMAEHLVRVEALKQLAIKGKIKQAIEWVREYLDQNGNKLVVFAVHKSTIDALMTEFKGAAVKIDGSTNSEQRNQAVEDFQNNPEIKLFVGNIKAAGTGLTLTASSAVAFLELPWTPGELVQAEDRCHRIGQKDTVNIYYLLANGTIEEDIASLLDSKRKVVDAILDGGHIGEDVPVLTQLMRQYEEKGGI